MSGIPADWTGGIDDLVAQANASLSRLLPWDRSGRPKDEVNPRLVRHYTTQGLLPMPRREGRDARYDRRHLLALLALRRLMADGLSGKALMSALSGADDHGLERLAVEGAVQGGAAEASSPLEYLRALKERAANPARRPDVAASGVGNVFTGVKRSSVAVTGASRVTRVEVQPGLVMEVGDQLRVPVAEAAWLELLADVRAALGVAVALREGTSGSVVDVGETEIRQP